MTLFDAIICGFAVWQIVEVWHHGSLFRNARDVLSVLYIAPSSWKITRWFAHVMLCPWCLSIYTALAVVVYYILAKMLFGVIGLIPVYALAISRIANVFNDLAYPYTRTPKSPDGM
jgi:hypothetical protein